MSDGVIRAQATDVPADRTRVLLWLWAIYPVLIPFYFMGRTLNPGTQKFVSGVPQVADYYFAAFMSVVFVSLPFRLPRPSVGVAVAMAGFVAYTALINSVWAAHLEDLSLLKSTLFYAYDGLLFATCLLLYEQFKEQFLRVTVYAVMASVVLQALLLPLSIDSAQSRQALFFNDENQLGYYCLLAATIVTLGARRFAIPVAYQAFFYGAVGYQAFLSQCRSALIAMGVLLFIAVMERPMRMLLVTGTLVAVYLTLHLEPSIFGKTEERLVVAGEYDTPETRGYDRIINYPQHTLVGAGEGAYERFRSALYASEIHSSYGTLLFCYGIIGTALFTAALLLLARADLRTALFLVPPFAYGMAHHGVRAAFFWVTLAVLTCIALCRPAAVVKNGAPG